MMYSSSLFYCSLPHTAALPHIAALPHTAGLPNTATRTATHKNPIDNPRPRRFGPYNYCASLGIIIPPTDLNQMKKETVKGGLPC